MTIAEIVKNILDSVLKKPEPPPAAAPPIPLRPFDIPKPVALEIPIGTHYRDQVKKYQAAVIRPENHRRCHIVTLAALRERNRYQSVSDKTGVPWYVIACLHRRESDQHWKAVLHNGEKIVGTGLKTKKVPAGCGPFDTWEDAAIDAIKTFYFRPKEWSIGGILEFCERYNGLGYRNEGAVSPYLWGHTSNYVKGQFRDDGVFDPEFVEDRAGIAPILKCLEELNQIKLV